MNSPDEQNMIPPSPSIEKKKSRWLVLLRPRYAIPLMVIALLIALPLAYRSSQIARLPDVGEPFDVEAFLKVTVPDERNAYVEYRQAEKLCVGFKGSYDIQSDPKSWNWATASPEIRKWLDDNQPALEVWYRGTQKPEGQYIHPQDIAYNVMIPVTQSLQELNQLAILQATKLQSEHEYEKAWNWLHAALRCSRHAGNHAFLIERHVGQRHFSRTIPFIIGLSRNEKVGQQLLVQMFADFNQNLDEIPNLVNTMKLEYLSSIRSIEDRTFEKDFLRDKKGIEKKLWKLDFWLNANNELGQRVVNIVYRNRFEYLAKPRRERPEIKGYIDTFCDSTGKVLGTDLTWQELDELALDTFSGEYIGGFAEIEKLGVREQALQNCLELSLAAQIYYRKHNKFPSKLDDLKTILGEIPVDPFAKKANQPLFYKQEKNGFVVWSVGENGVDDAGDVGFEDDKKYADVGIRVK